MKIFNPIFRNFQRKKLITSLRIFSLFIGGAVALYIFEYNKQQKSFDNFWKNGERIYRIALQEERNGEVVSSSARCFGAAPLLFKTEIPGVENGTYFGKDKITVFCNEQQFNNVNWLWSDTAIFNSD